MGRTVTDAEVDAVWEEFWLPLLIAEDGTLDLAKIKNELFDYHTCMGEVSKVYDSITEGRFSKCNTAAFHVLSAVDEIQSRRVDECVKEALDEAVA